MDLILPKKMKPLLTKKKRFKVLIGGRGSGKSTGIANAMILKSITENAKIGCFREFQNSIDDSVYSLLTSEIERQEVNEEFNIQASQISTSTGGYFTFKGLARNPHSIKSMDGFNVFWIEEAQAISETSLRLLTPTLRTTDSELWFSANPQSRADPFSQRFIVPFQDDLDKYGYYEDDLHIIIKINYDDNPFFPPELEAERLWDYENLSRALYDHIWEGGYMDIVEDSIISADWFDAAIDAHEKLGWKPRGAIVAAHDPSDMGKDAKGLAIRHGSLVTHVASMDTGDVNEGCDWATDLATVAKANYFIYDSDGLGASLRRQITDSFNGMDVSIKAFKGSHGAENPSKPYQAVEGERASVRTNKETFKNQRAQMYWKLRDRFYNTYRAIVHGEYCDPDDMISLSGDIAELNMLRAEVCRIPRIPNGAGLIQIMPKDQMKSKLGIQSPNLADALMMTMVDCIPPKKQRPVIDFASNF